MKDYNKKIGIQIHTINNMIMRKIDNNPSTKLLKNMTGTNAWLIAYIAEQSDIGKEVFQKDIEEAFCITRSTVSKVINLMEKKGLVKRQSVSYDARLKKLVLTEEANKFASKLKDEAEQMEDKIEAGFSSEELEQLFNYFERIQKNLA